MLPRPSHGNQLSNSRTTFQEWNIQEPETGLVVELETGQAYIIYLLNIACGQKRHLKWFSSHDCDRCSETLDACRGGCEKGEDRDDRRS